MQNNGDVKVLIAEIKGTVNVVLARVDSLVKSVDQLTSTAVTKEELELIIKPIKSDVIRNRDDIKKVLSVATWVIGAIAFGVLGMVIAHAIPGFEL